MRLFAIVQEYIKQRRLQKALEKNQWYDVIIGDVLEYKDGLRILYLGIDEYGGIGERGTPEPVFRTADPRASDIRYFLRPKYDPDDNVFGENHQPVRSENSGLYLAFLNADRTDFEKVDHIPPHIWNTQVDEIMKGLAGQ